MENFVLVQYNKEYVDINSIKLEMVYNLYNKKGKVGTLEFYFLSFVTSKHNCLLEFYNNKKEKVKIYELNKETGGHTYTDSAGSITENMKKIIISALPEQIYLSGSVDKDGFIFTFTGKETNKLFGKLEVPFYIFD